MEPAIVVALLAAAGLFLLGLCVARVFRRRPLAAARSGVAASACLALAGLVAAVALNLHTYRRLTHEQPVMTLAFQQIAPRRFAARLRQPDAPVRRYELAGDQWQLDARVLKWSGIANLLGLDAQYRLERLSGRYASGADDASLPRTVHDLSGNRGLDVWRVAQRYPDWLPLVDARYGSATYLPMADGAAYAVALTQSGLIARPLNDAARYVIHGW